MTRLMNTEPIDKASPLAWETICKMMKMKSRLKDLMKVSIFSCQIGFGFLDGDLLGGGNAKPQDCSIHRAGVRSASLSPPSPPQAMETLLKVPSEEDLQSRKRRAMN